nr:hypothetical protein [Tanacetum cinerariifolium]
MVKLYTDLDVADLLTKGFDAERFQYLVSREADHVCKQARMNRRTCYIKQKCVKSQSPRKIKRGRNIKIPQSGDPPKKVGDKAVYKELGDRMEKATATASSLEVEQDSWRTIADTEILLDQEEPSELVEDLGSGEKGEKEISIFIPEVSTAAENLVYFRRSAEKRNDKGKAIMKEDKHVQKKSKKQLEQERLRHEEAIRLQEHIFEKERQRIAKDAEIAKQLQEDIAKANSAHDIVWNDPAVLRYHALQNRSFSVAEVRKNMCMYLKNQEGYKMSHFKRMSYEDIKLIFERKKDDSSSKPIRGSRKKTVTKKRSGAKLDEESAKRQKLKDEALNAAKKHIAKLESKNFNLQNKIQNDDHDVMIQENHISNCGTMPAIKSKELAPGKYAIDIEPIPPRIRSTREVHLDYLKHLKESVETLRVIVEEAKVKRPLDRSLASACL